MAFIETTIRGQKITAAFVKTASSKLASHNDNITLLANYGAVCAVFHNGNDVLNNLLKLDLFHKQNGELNAEGNKLVAYILAHAPLLVHTDKGFVQRQFKGKKADDKDNFRFIFDVETGEKTDSHDFTMTFREFKEYQKPKGNTDATKTVTADSVEKAALKAITAIEEGAFSMAENSALLQTLIDLQNALLKEMAKRKAAKPAVDTDKTEQLANLKPSSKEKAANIKAAV